MIAEGSLRLLYLNLQSATELAGTAWPRIVVQPDLAPVGTENPVTSCDVQVLVQQAAEPVAS
jgi:hypothetical protein